MAKINACLKRTFTFFNFLFAIVGGVIISVALLLQVFSSSDQFEGRMWGLIFMYSVGSITMAIAILGAYGAHRESLACLIVFVICMVMGSISMLRLGVSQAVARPSLEAVLSAKLRESLPLDEASEEVKTLADNLQTMFQCCGLFSYNDWQGHLPDSCICDPWVVEGNCRSVEYKDFFKQEVKSVYALTCFPVFWHYVSLVIDFILGVVFFLASLALLGMILSGLMIHQMRPVSKSMEKSYTMTIPTIYSPQPPKYKELFNSPDN